MPGFKTIVVPTDFSPASERAIMHARELAERFGASVLLLHVVEDPYAAAAWSEAFLAMPDIREPLRQEALKRLEEAASAFAGLPTTMEAVVGTPAATIVKAAADRSADLIVMGTHGRSGVAHLLLGSVAERVIRLAPCPVLTVRESQGQATDAPGFDERGSPRPRDSAA